MSAALSSHLADAAPPGAEASAESEFTADPNYDWRHSRGNEPGLGRRFHVFDKHYVLVGINQEFGGNRASQVEISYLPQWAISKYLTWFGAWAASGVAHTEGWQASYGAGLEGGFRVLALDAGYIRQGEQDWFRGRVGLSAAWEWFTLDNQQFGRHCAEGETFSEVECDRTPAGFSIFAYYSPAFCLDGGCSEPDGNTENSTTHTLGVSLKIGVGL